MRNIEQKNKTYSREKKLHLFFFLLPCLALAQYPKAMDFSKLYQGKLDSVAVIHRTGWTKETSWLGAPEEERITEKRKRLPLYKYTKESDCLKYCITEGVTKKNILY
ncbi:hypothetical protein [Capnocytophaga gingivalis]|uniref:hypothetical protein n=1 Tax=Capnocytophaga gingivalis TaxID=1017 RepID=UPI002354013E|nr:hypothetical protein [Capnocytophaga gingivalis]